MVHKNAAAGLTPRMSLPPQIAVSDAFPRQRCSHFHSASHFFQEFIGPVSGVVFDWKKLLLALLHHPSDSQCTVFLSSETLRMPPQNWHVAQTPCACALTGKASAPLPPFGCPPCSMRSLSAARAPRLTRTPVASTVPPAFRKPRRVSFCILHLLG